MFQAKLEEGILFKKIVDSIKDLVKQVNIDANPNGLSMQAMDSAHVALVSLKLNENGFKDYRCDRPLTLGLSIENLSKILKCAGGDDIITLQTDEEEPSTLRFLFENPQATKISEFSLNLLSLDSEALGIPETEYSSTIEMPSSEFSRICKELSSISETVEIETSKETAKFSVSGDIGNGSITIKHNEGEKEGEKVCLNVDQPVKLTFALRYLNMFNKAMSLSNQVSLNMSEENPLMVEYKIGRLGTLRFYLAPKINDEEN
ncbi:proliferating cell nuclear antigen, putative [Ichthyophthirius multifiliis]|uniref:DNA sliding clamp PCNA n=1 Tax=Ichthyophthirius multifiliis TaxID=5932 RepID=G0QYC8_ICHMU|nr:proliferating cell nuclear antigen, putative [Ichthyophthirius multifiliis]EGR29791.1 proliferating cell nuclear antigen, putative [Ichthyophthirius multifiliis]|eukprot:XP_004031027.1 proliferating cell nuclear antigen, putative [Ichthyophthirius multifiliis]